jgi:hypothetical protein
MVVARARFFFFTFVFIVLGGCSLFTDLDGLADEPTGDDAGGAAETGSPPTGEAGVMPDGGALPDGGGQPDGMTSPLSCPANARLCDDFERMTATLRGPWEQEIVAAGGTLKIESGRLIASVPGKAAAGGDEPLAFLQKTVSGSLTKFVAEMDVGFDRRPSATAYHLFVKVRIDVPGGGFQLVYLTVDSGGNGFALQDFTTGPPAPLEYKGFNMDTNVRHLKLEYALGAKSRLFIDGAMIHEINTPAFMKAGTMQLTAGVSGSYNEAATVPITVTTDNVVFLAE